jgi:hypothetical protein
MIADYLQGISGLIEALAVATATGLAIYGYNAWRTQLIGRRKVEVAEKALLATYRARDAFEYIRTPASFIGEGESREKKPEEDKELASVLNLHFVPIERINNNAGVFSELQKVRLLCRVHFGPTAQVPFDSLLTVRHRIIVAARMLGMTARSRVQDERIDPKLRKEWEAAIWSGLDEQDALQTMINTAVADVESICIKYLS